MRAIYKYIYLTLIILLSYKAMIHSEVGFPNILDAHAMPSWASPLGRDHMGRDLFTRITEAIVLSTLPLIVLCVISQIFGIFTSSMMLVTIAYWPSRTVKHLQISLLNLCQIVTLFPIFLFVFIFGVIFEEFDYRGLCLSIIIYSFWRGFSIILELYERDKHLLFWQSHESIGGHIFQRILVYGIRGQWQYSIRNFMIQGYHLVIIAEATLSYLGIGIQEPQASFGNIIASNLDLAMKGNFWIVSVTTASLIIILKAPEIFLPEDNSGSRQPIALTRQYQKVANQP